METKLDKIRMEKVRRRCGFENGFEVVAEGSRGGLCMAWKKDITVRLRSFSKWHIDVLVKEENVNEEWRYTGFYGSPYVKDKIFVWNLLRRLAQEIDFPWLVLGDFNDILYSFEKSGRILGDDIDNLPFSFSDHCPLILNTNKSLHFTGSRKFHFEAWWTLEDSFEKVIREAWEVTGGSLLEKLRKLQICLEDWSSKNRQHREGLKKRLLQELEDLVGRERNDETLAKTIDTKIHLNLEIDKDEMYWEQQARQNWLKFGDKNTAFFHRCALNRRQINTISKLVTEGGVEIEEGSEILNAASSFFQNLFKLKGVTDSCKVLNGIEKTVTQEDNEFLLAPYRADEIQVALEGMGPTKAPGADGFSVLFFQRYWHVVGQDVIDFCLDILNNNQEFGDFNNTDIVLIPKVPKPTHLVNFRPISLCSVIYKVVAKTIGNRLQKIIDKCIDKIQSAFVPGRLITDNVLLAYEILHTLKQKRSGKKGVMAVKLDMSKAYDRVEWGFLEVVMTKMGFAKEWTELLLRCITSVRYAVNINGRRGNLFQPSRGLRQGDPLSPLLFLMCSEGLSSLMRTSMKQGSIKGVKASRKGPAISHLLFADDCILFGEASPKGARILKDILQDYEKCSDQCVNFSKSTVFFSPNTIEEDKATVSRLLGVRIASNPEKYLGLPNMIGSSVNKVEVLINRKTREWNREEIEYTFGADEVDKILRIPLAQSPHDDFFSLEGHFSASRVVARDNIGSVLVSKSRVHEKVCSTFEAEALACREVIQLGIDMQEKNIIIEGDSLTVIKKCRQDSVDRS
ncbi:reverse transcriptase [Gossypium australe]|uniref:Reverse transcriptase n=1 Tax=Gossypium australe TaxID=47621 RepID=A0A5B6V1T9_9ROSI|nr:reverse transcriptase [Gossypium australe]